LELTTLQVVPMSGSLGAEVRDVDLCSLDDETWSQIYELWLQNLVLFFPEQEMSPEDHVAFARRFGTVDVHPYLPTLSDERPEIAVISSDSGGAAIWHTDMTFQSNPPKASILRMADCPPRGGDTLWMNQYAAYESLSAPMRDLLEGLSAIHTAKGLGQPDVQVEHPAVITHPETARRALYVNRSFTSHFVQLRPAESDALLQFLLMWTERPEFQCRYRWSPGAVAVWDNRCTQHYAAGDYVGYRRIERVTVVGDDPAVGDGRKWQAYEGDVLELYRSQSHINPPIRTSGQNRS